MATPQASAVAFEALAETIGRVAPHHANTVACDAMDELADAVLALGTCAHADERVANAHSFRVMRSMAEVSSAGSPAGSSVDRTLAWLARASAAASSPIEHEAMYVSPPPFVRSDVVVNINVCSAHSFLFCANVTHAANKSDVCGSLRA
jgi:hypothetical protein